MSLSATSLGLILATVILFVLLARTTYQYKRQTRRMGSGIEHKMQDLEKKLAALERDYDKLLSETNKKVDKKYLENRIKGLSELMD